MKLKTTSAYAIYLGIIALVGYLTLTMGVDYCRQKGVDCIPDSILPDKYGV